MQLLVFRETKDKDEMINCKSCGYEVIKTKIIMHLKRSKKGCKEKYGNEFDELKAKQAKARKEYLKAAQAWPAQAGQFEGIQQEHKLD